MPHAVYLDPPHIGTGQLQTETMTPQMPGEIRHDDRTVYWSLPDERAFRVAKGKAIQIINTHGQPSWGHLVLQCRHMVELGR